MNLTSYLSQFLSLILILNCSLLSGQSESDYLFKTVSGPVPAAFTIDIDSVANLRAAGQSILIKAEAVEYYRRSLNNSAELMQSGLIYVKNEATEYLEKIVAELLANDPELKSQVELVLVRKDDANALMTAGGLIVVSVPLLSRLENSSQLAFVLAHEISHLKKQHSLKAEQSQKNRNEKEPLSLFADVYKLLKYSKELEFEADAAGIELLTDLEYDSREASNALLILNKDLYSDSLKKSLASVFNSDIFQINEALITDSLIVKSLKDTVIKTFSLIKGNDDAGKTHPDLEKRALAISEILNIMDYKVKLPPNEEEFLRIRTKAQHEEIYNLYIHSEYLHGLYKSLLLLERMPEDEYAEVLVVKNLFGLCKFKENGVMKEYLEEIDLKKNKSLAKLMLLVSKTDSKELGRMLYSFAKSAHEKHPENEELLFYKGAAAELHLSKDAAAVIYRNYTTKYPDGRYTGYANSKLN